MDVVIGPEIIRSYKRLSYTPWHALAEFIDNSTQSFFDNRTALTGDDPGGDPPLSVDIVYSLSESGSITIRDNAMGMSEEELTSALHIGRPRVDTSGRSEFGMGLKTAACWFGNRWSVRTKKLGEKLAHEIEFNVETVASGISELPHRTFEESELEHYTVVHINDLNHLMSRNEVAQVKRFLESMYRVDTREKTLLLTFNGRTVDWVSPVDSGNIHSSNGENFYLEFPRFPLNEKSVSGWIAILERGSRTNAGFTIIRRGRVIKGYPDAWKPREIFGQYQGSNDLVNQRLTGEIHLDDFEVSHTKDNILWGDGEEEGLGRALGRIAERYIEIALSYRKLGTRQSPPSRSVINSAVGLLEEELDSSDIRQIIAANGSVPLGIYEQIVDPMMQIVESTETARTYQIDELTVIMYLAENLSQTDPYLGVAIHQDGALIVAVNMNHPHVESLRGSIGVFNHLKSCAYEGLAQWKAEKMWGSESPVLIRAMKDAFLRVGQSIYDRTD